MTVCQDEDQKAVCRCLGAILKLANPATKTRRHQPMLAEWPVEILFPLSLSLSIPDA